MGITVAAVIAMIAAAPPKLLDKPLAAQTLKSYGGRLSVVARGMKKETDMKALLENFASVDAWVDAKGWAKSTYTLTYTSLYRAAQVLGLTKVADHYNDKMTSYSKENIEVTKQNKGKESIEKATGNATLSLSDLQSKVRALSDYDADHALLALYILMPPRRLEYRYLKYYGKNPMTGPEPSGVKDIRPARRPVEEREDDDGIGWNFVYKKSSKVLRMVLRVHKEAGVQGVYATDLSEEVSGILMKYITLKKVSDDGGDLFRKPNAQGNNHTYESPAFSLLITRVLKRLTGIDNLTANDLRHAAATNIRAGNTATYAAKEDLARAMGHSVNTADLTYNKVATPPPAPSSSSKGKGKAKGPPTREEFDAILERLAKVEAALKALGVSV